MDIIVKVCTDPEEYDEGPEMEPVDKAMVGQRMKALLGVGGVPRLRGMSEKQRQEELTMLITQLTGEVPEGPEED